MHTNSVRPVGFVVMSTDGAPARSRPSKKRITLFQRAGHARHFVKEYHPHGKVLPAFTKPASSVSAHDMLIGLYLVDHDGRPLRTGKKGGAVRLYRHAGFAELAKRHHGARALRKVYI